MLCSMRVGLSRTDCKAGPGCQLALIVLLELRSTAPSAQEFSQQQAHFSASAPRLSCTAKSVPMQMRSIVLPMNLDRIPLTGQPLPPRKLQQPIAAYVALEWLLDPYSTWSSMQADQRFTLPFYVAEESRAHVEGGVLVARSQSGSVGRQALLAHDVSNGSHGSLPFVACCSCQQNVARRLLRTAA